jgi:HK97 family phage prohead protease
MQNRAYSVLNVKAVDDAARVIRGIATSPTVDRVGDIIEPLGMKFTNPMPFLWQHMHDKPIGTVKFNAPTASGIGFEATIAHPDTVESETLKERLREAWDSLRIGLVRAVSVGFRPIEYSYMEEGGVRFIESECFELSAVTIPANSDAVINEIKSIDAALRKAAGVSDPEVPAAPAGAAASGKSVRVVLLDDPARDRAPPFVIRAIKRLT